MEHKLDMEHARALLFSGTEQDLIARDVAKQPVRQTEALVRKLSATSAKQGQRVGDKTATPRFWNGVCLIF